MNKTTLRRVLIVTMVSALPFAAIVPSACSGGGVAAEPALVTAFQDLQIDAIKILPEAIVTKRLDEFEPEDTSEEFEVFLFDDATDSEFYCSGRTEGMVTVNAVNVAYTNLGATFLPMQHQKVVVGANPAATLDRVRVEVWEMDHGVCPGQTETTETDNFFTDANDLVAVQVFPAKALLAAQELNIDNKVTMTISLKGGAIVVDPSLAVPELKTIQLESVTLGPLVGSSSATWHVDVALFNAETGAAAACVGVGLQQSKTSGLALPLQFADGVSALPSVVRAGLVRIGDSTGCPGGIQPGLGADLFAISARIPITQLVGTPIIMNDNVHAVTFATAESTEESDKAVFDFQPYAKLRVEKMRYAATSVSESSCTFCTTKTPEIEVVLFTADHKPVACAGEKQGLAVVDDPAVLYEALNTPLIQAWTTGTLAGDTFYWGLVERDAGTCPDTIYTNGGDQIFAKSDVHTLPELVGVDIPFPDIVNAIITVIQQP